MGCATTTVKISSIVFNVILALLGIAVIVFIATKPDELPEEFAIAAYIVCSLVIIFAILGCYAAIRESVCLTATCAVFLLALAILQIATSAMETGNDLRTGVATVEEAWEKNNMEVLQLEHECCGKDSAQDYVLLNQQIPKSCYAEENAADVNGIFIEGCIVKLQEYYETEKVREAIVYWLLIAFEILGFLLATFLVINFRNKQRRLQF